ncbi:MAG: radical SAM protein, partial [Nanobdellota archaeon]
MGEKARFYEASTDSEVVTCTACAFYCKLNPGMKGLCGVRHNEKGVLMNDVYGNIAALNIDPIEKKPFYHFKPGKQALSVGTV